MNFTKTFLLLAVLTSLFMAIGYMLGGTGGVGIAFIMASAMNFFAYWNSDKIVLKMMKATVADEREFKLFYHIVKEQTQKANMPMPKLYVMQEDMPNAFATGRNPENAAVAVTTGIWNLLNKEEISGVIAHELAHIKNKDTLISTIAATFAGAISMIANMFMFMNLFSNNSENKPHPVVGIFIMILAPIAATIIQMAVSRQREYAADKLGGEICGNPLYLASALQKLENYSHKRTLKNATPATSHMYIINPLKGNMDNVFSTHPNTQNRIKSLQAQADLLGLNYKPSNLSLKETPYNNTHESKVAYKDSHIKDNPWLDETEKHTTKENTKNPSSYEDSHVKNNPWL